MGARTLTWRSTSAVNGRGPAFSAQARRDSNPQPPVLETGALPIELRTSILNSAPACADCEWPGTESNRRHRGFQPRALPPELPGRAEPNCQSCRTNQTPPRAAFEQSSGGRIRTCDLRVMSPTSYLAAPPRNEERKVTFTLLEGQPFQGPLRPSLETPDAGWFHLFPHDEVHGAREALVGCQTPLGERTGDPFRRIYPGGPTTWTATGLFYGSPDGNGTWRSPVAHRNGVAGVAGSNPAVPTEAPRSERSWGLFGFREPKEGGRIQRPRRRRGRGTRREPRTRTVGSSRAASGERVLPQWLSARRVRTPPLTLRARWTAASQGIPRVRRTAPAAPSGRPD